MKPDEVTRQNIDRMLTSAGWSILSMENFKPEASTGVAVREFHTKKDVADYLLLIDGRVTGVIEVKPSGAALSPTADQTAKYIHGIPDDIPHPKGPIPFTYESCGTETYFRDEDDPNPSFRRIFSFHRPETLKELISKKSRIRSRLTKMPPLAATGLRKCQEEAIIKLEESFAANQPRTLIQMAAGTGKTFTAVSFIYRLLNFAQAGKVLYLVDHSNLAGQVNNEFNNYLPPGESKKFTELYKVQHLTGNLLDPDCRVCITTPRRLFSMLKGEESLKPGLEDKSSFNISLFEEKTLEVTYNDKIPPETFDFIITDECHPSVFKENCRVWEYFDAFIIGLTAVPLKETLDFFFQNLAADYCHERAVADGLIVGYEVYRIKTENTEKLSRADFDFYVDKRDKLTRKQHWEQGDDDMQKARQKAEQNIITQERISDVIKTFKENLFSRIFPQRKEIPKTLIFAGDDSQAERITNTVKKEFGIDSKTCQDITSRASGEKVEDRINNFSKSYNPRIAVAVDMISTGIDLKPLECLLFLREVKSLSYFEQMKGRGTRTISSSEFNTVTPDAKFKTHFTIVDAVGICENDITDFRPLERKKSLTFEKLITHVTAGKPDEDIMTTLAGRLAQLDRELEGADREEIKKILRGQSLPDVVNNLLDAVDPDIKINKAREVFGTKTPSQQQIKPAIKQIIVNACSPFHNADFRNILIKIKARKHLIINTAGTTSKEGVIKKDPENTTRKQAEGKVDKFLQFLEDKKEQLTAQGLVYRQPGFERQVTFAQIKSLAEALEEPPYSLSIEALWKAFAELEPSKVKSPGSPRMITDLISLIRFTLGKTEDLKPFAETVNRQFDLWIAAGESSGKRFTIEQIEWLQIIKDHIITSLSFKMEDLNLASFQKKGGAIEAFGVFGTNFNTLIDELNSKLTD